MKTIQTEVHVVKDNSRHWRKANMNEKATAYLTSLPVNTIVEIELPSGKKLKYAVR